MCVLWAGGVDKRRRCRTRVRCRTPGLAAFAALILSSRVAREASDTSALTCEPRCDARRAVARRALSCAATFVPHPLWVRAARDSGSRHAPRRVDPPSRRAGFAVAPRERVHAAIGESHSRPTEEEPRGRHRARGRGRAVRSRGPHLLSRAATGAGRRRVPGANVVPRRTVGPGGLCACAHSHPAGVARVRRTRGQTHAHAGPRRRVSRCQRQEGHEPVSCVRTSRSLRQG